jgi:hypothetical protein
MKTSIKRLAPWLAAFAIGGTVALAPVAEAATNLGPVVVSTAPAAPGTGTDPLIPFGTDPMSPYRLGLINPNHDGANTSNGQLDAPF